jgi:hypothetical protein
MQTHGFVGQWSTFVGLAIGASLSTGSAFAQPPAPAQKVMMKFRVVEANNSANALIPKGLWLFVRNPSANEPVRRQPVAFRLGQGGYYEAVIPSGYLVERLIVAASDQNGNGFNPTSFYNVISVGEISITFAAYDPSGTFSPTTFSHQLETYREFYTLLSRTRPPSEAQFARLEILREFGPLLIKTALAERHGGFVGFTAEEVESAKQQVESLLQLLGILAPGGPTNSPPQYTLVAKNARCTFRRGLVGRACP